MQAVDVFERRPDLWKSAPTPLPARFLALGRMQRRRRGNAALDGSDGGVKNPAARFPPAVIGEHQHEVNAALDRFSMRLG